MRGSLQRENYWEEGRKRGGGGWSSAENQCGQARYREDLGDGKRRMDAEDGGILYVGSRL